jgi:hypothetical protein
VSILDDIKTLADLVRKIGDMELNRRILSLEGEAIELIRGKRELETQVEDLKQALEFKETLEFVEPFYFKKGDNTPFCARCWETERAAIHLANDHSKSGVWICPKCNHPFVVTRDSHDRLKG